MLEFLEPTTYYRLGELPLIPWGERRTHLDTGVLLVGVRGLVPVDMNRIFTSHPAEVIGLFPHCTGECIITRQGTIIADGIPLGEGLGVIHEYTASEIITSCGRYLTKNGTITHTNSRSPWIKGLHHIFDHYMLHLDGSVTRWLRTPNQVIWQHPGPFVDLSSGIDCVYLLTRDGKVQTLRTGAEDLISVAYPERIVRLTPSPPVLMIGESGRLWDQDGCEIPVPKPLVTALFFDYFMCGLGWDGKVYRFPFRQLSAWGRWMNKPTPTLAPEEVHCYGAV